ncbi:hypothetical protein DFJ74DRAFT_502200 [Hyaloraphidium curvatum]|nr:hypothetical protein DFJ74DRAFT_502200 [Hyaloraphidium curvatum]
MNVPLLDLLVPYVRIHCDATPNLYATLLRGARDEAIQLRAEGRRLTADEIGTIMQGDPVPQAATDFVIRDYPFTAEEIKQLVQWIVANPSVSRVRNLIALVGAHLDLVDRAETSAALGSLLKRSLRFPALADELLPVGWLMPPAITYDILSDCMKAIHVKSIDALGTFKKLLAAAARQPAIIGRANMARKMAEGRGGEWKDAWDGYERRYQAKK